MGMAYVVLTVLFAAGLPAWAEEPQPGQIGVRYQLESEGMVLTQVNPGMGGAAAGLQGGDLVTAIVGAPTPVSFKKWKITTKVKIEAASGVGTLVFKWISELDDPKINPARLITEQPHWESLSAKL